MDFSGLKEIVKDLTQSAEARAVSRALKCFSKGQLDKAIEILLEARQASPEDADVLFDLCRYLVLANRGSEAAEALRSVLRRHPRSFRRASEMIEELRAKHATVSPLFDAVAEHFIRQNDFKSALDAFERMRPEEIRSFLPRHKGKWDGLRKSAPDAKMAKTSLQSAYTLALCHEALREYDPAATIYRLVAKNNPEELPKVLERLQALLARDYQNAALRAAVGDLHLRAGREDDAVQQFALVIETDARGGAPVAERVQEYLKEKGEKPGLRWILVSALLAAGDEAAAVDAMRPLVESGALLNQVVPALEGLAASEKDKSGHARLLLASALARRGQPQTAVDILMAIAEEKGLPAIREPLETIAATTPASARVHHLLADVHLAEGRAGAAVECLRKARSLAPQEESLLIPRLTKILDADPASPEAHLLLADLLLKSGERDRAIVLLRHLVREAPVSSGEGLARFAAILNDDPQSPRGRIGATEARLRCGRDSPEAAEARVLLATLCLDRQDYKGALAELARGGFGAGPLLDRVIEKYEEILARSPDDLEARTGFVEALLQGKRYDRVLSAGAETLKLKDDETTARVSVAMGDALRERGDSDSAVKRYFAAYGKNRSLGSAVIERLRSLIDAEGTHPLAALALGKVLGSEGLCAEAVEALGAARTADPKLSDAVLGELQRLRGAFPAETQVGLSMLLILGETGDHKRAVQVISSLLDLPTDLASVLAGHLDRILKADPQLAFATFEMGRALQQLKLMPRSAATYLNAFRLDASLAPLVLKRLQEMIETDPTCPDPYVAACAIHAARGKFQAAAEKIEQALDKMPGEAERLLPRLEEIQKQNKGSATISLLLADACMRAGKHDRALAAYGESARRDAGLIERALQGIEAVLKAAPKMGEAYLWRGRLRAHRMLVDQALADLHQAARLKPELWPAIIEEAEALRARAPESHGCALLVADHHAASGKGTG